MKAFLGILVGSGIAVMAGRVAADAPPGRYTYPDPGTVYDTKTTLTWQQTVPDSSYAWEDAKAYCQGLSLAGSGWRLPSTKELQTIVDDSTSSPAIDPTAFPATPSESFWTSTPVAGSPSEARYVFFKNGVAFRQSVATPKRVRCVR